MCAQAEVTKYQEWGARGRASTSEMYQLTILEASLGRSKIEVSAGLASEAVLDYLSHSPPLASGGLLAFLSNPWLVDITLISALSSNGIPVCVSVQVFPFYKDTSHLGLGPTLMTST